MIRTQVYIPDQLYDLAKLCAQQEGVSISEYIRQGLEIRMKNKGAGGSHRNPKNSFADLCGKYRLPAGKTDIATTHNEIYDA